MKNGIVAAAVERSGTLDVSSAQELRIDSEGMSIIMSLLSNLYSYPHRAVVREYACNARDSHIEAGVTRPIEVTLPTPLDPQFKIQDFGLGLSAKEIVETYGSYGASTKRNTDLLVGAFGIGAKSAFAVATQFTVTGVKNGEKTIALFALNDEGKPTLQILYSGETSEDNGVTIDIGVDNVAEVVNAARWLFKFWPKGSVLVNGEEPETLWPNLEKVADGTYLDWKRASWRSTGSAFTLVMGGVPYPLQNALLDQLSSRELWNDLSARNVSYVLEVPIGAVDIAPSREELKTTARTLNYVESRLSDLNEAFNKWIGSQIASAPTLWDAGRAYTQLREKVNYQAASNLVTWRGQLLGPQTYNMLASTFRADAGSRYDSYGRRRYSSRLTVVQDDHHAFVITSSDEAFSRTLVVTDVPKGKESTVKSYAKEYVVAEWPNKSDYDYVIAFPDSDFQHCWFCFGEKHPESLIKTMSYQDYRKDGLARRKKRIGLNGPRSKTTYPVRQLDGSAQSLTAAEIADLDKIVLYHRASNDFQPTVPAFDAQWKTDHYVGVFISANKSVDAFLRQVPDALAWTDVRKGYAEKAFDSFTQQDMDLYARSIDSGIDYPKGVEWIEKHADKITNKAVLDYAEKARNRSTPFTPAETARVECVEWVCRFLGKPLPDRSTDDETWFRTKLPLLAVHPYSRYSLVRICGGDTQADQALIDYVNGISV